MKTRTIAIGVDELEFLKESNAIEGVHDPDSMKQAIEAWTYLKSEKRITTYVVKKMHKILMLHQDLMPNEKGYYRTVQVWVGNREGMPHEKIPQSMQVWCDAVNNLVMVSDLSENKRKTEPNLLGIMAQYQHVKYEKIHPFIDGNGRTGRMLLNWTRLHLDLGLLIIHTGKEQQAYYRWFK